MACIAAFAVVVVAAVSLYLPSVSEFYNHTIGFQLNRADVFSPWALHPGLDPVKIALEVGAVLLAALVAFLPRERYEPLSPPDDQAPEPVLAGV